MLGKWMRYPIAVVLTLLSAISAHAGNGPLADLAEHIASDVKDRGCVVSNNARACFERGKLKITYTTTAKTHLYTGACRGTFLHPGNVKVPQDRLFLHTYSCKPKYAMDNKGKVLLYFQALLLEFAEIIKKEQDDDEEEH
jgi:hypothetical protein